VKPSMVDQHKRPYPTLVLKGIHTHYGLSMCCRVSICRSGLAK